MDYQKLINTSIKNLRLENNLTQEEFSEKVAISIQGLSNIERNRYQPTADTVDKICKAFKITPSELLLNIYDKNSAKEDIISNITILLKQCPKAKLKKIYKIISLLTKL